MLQRPIKKKSSYPSPDKADSPAAPAQSADKSIDLAQALSMASQYHDAGQFFEVEVAHRQMPRTEHVCAEVVLVNAANLLELNQIRRELSNRMTSRLEINPLHVTRSLESAYHESWRKWCESLGAA